MSAAGRFFLIPALSVVIVFLTGCSSFQIVNERAVTLEEIVKMSQAGVGKDVIISQIGATHSRFRLTSDEIVKLTEAGVNEEIIETMIETGARPEPYGWEYSTGPFDNWVNNWDYYGYGYLHPYDYYYPYYSSYYYYSPYVMYRSPGLVGRFYRYSPVQPPSRRYNRESMERRYRRDDSTQEKEDDR
ncbi:hypothetical protein LLG96_19565 [bacterium]|nr:hypothetical protein [bacterium]